MDQSKRKTGAAMTEGGLDGNAWAALGAAIRALASEVMEPVADDPNAVAVTGLLTGGSGGEYNASLN